MLHRPRRLRPRRIDFVVPRRNSGDFARRQAQNGESLSAEIPSMRCPNCKTETSMCFACARCLRLFGTGWCCLSCLQVCQALTAPIDEKTDDADEAERPPTVH